jgi:hypothetical protein
VETIEQTLARELGRVAAPEELWDRVQLPGAIHFTVPRWMKLAGALAAVLVLAILFARRDTTNEALAVEALAEGPGGIQLQSDHAAPIRDWVQSRTGLDVPLRSDPPRPLQLTGARIVKGATVEIACRVGNRNAALVVSKSGFGFTGRAHQVLGSGWHKGVQVFSWIMRGQTFTLACATPEDLRIACLLCHGEAEHL